MSSIINPSHVPSDPDHMNAVCLENSVLHQARVFEISSNYEQISAGCYKLFSFKTTITLLSNTAVSDYFPWDFH